MSGKGRARIVTLAIAALLAAGGLVAWHEDIAQLLGYGSPFLLVGLVLVIPYLIVFATTIRYATSARLDDDKVLTSQVRIVQSLRWVGLALCVLIALGVAQPLFEDKWDYGVGPADLIAMAVNAVALSGMVFIAGVFLCLWILGVLEIIISAFALSSPKPSWDPAQEKPLPDSIVMKTLDAQVYTALSAIRPAWEAGSTQSNRLEPWSSYPRA